MSDSINNSPILEVENLTVEFTARGGTLLILKEISFTVFAGRTLGIVGESGSGKTMTAKSILQLIPTPPLSKITGKIKYLGDDLLTLNPRSLRNIRGNEIAYIFQEPMTALNPVLTIGDQITEMIRAHQKKSKSAARKKAIQLLTEVGISSPGERMHHYPYELSGGMRQRAMIAMALSCDPKILIADEPTTALDVTIQAQILELFSTIIQTRQMAMIFVTHDLSVIAEIADDVLVMKDGEIVEKNTVDEIFHHPSHPYTQMLLKLLPEGNRS